MVAEPTEVVLAFLLFDQQAIGGVRSLGSSSLRAYGVSLSTPNARPYPSIDGGDEAAAASKSRISSLAVAMHSRYGFSVEACLAPSIKWMYFGSPRSCSVEPSWYPIELDELCALCGLAIESGSLSRNYRSSARLAGRTDKRKGLHVRNSSSCLGIFTSGKWRCR